MAEMEWSAAPVVRAPELESASAAAWGPGLGAQQTGRCGVLHLINGEHYSGAERVQDLLAMRLPEFGFSVGFACVKPSGFARLRRSVSAPLFETPMRSALDLSAARLVTRIVRSGGYRLIHAHTPRTAMLGRIASWATGIPLVYHVHSPAGHETTDGVRNRCRLWMERWGLRSASRLITVSESLRRYMIEQGFAGERVRYVPNGVPTGGGENRTRQRGGLWRIGMLALFRPRKGLEILLQAMARLRSEGTELVLHAIGEFETPQYESAVRDLAASLGVARQIRWRGFRQDISRELAGIDLSVLPSLFGEGMPMVVLESLAAGVPVIASRVEGTADVVRDGVDGLLVEPGDAGGLATALRRFVSGEIDWQQTSRNGVARHAERFSDLSMARGVAQVYRELLATA